MGECNCNKLSFLSGIMWKKNNIYLNQSVVVFLFAPRQSSQWIRIKPKVFKRFSISSPDDHFGIKFTDRSKTCSIRVHCVVVSWEPQKSPKLLITIIIAVTKKLPGQETHAHYLVTEDFKSFRSLSSTSGTELSRPSKCLQCRWFSWWQHRCSLSLLDLNTHAKTEFCMCNGTWFIFAKTGANICCVLSWTLCPVGFANIFFEHSWHSRQIPAASLTKQHRERICSPPLKQMYPCWTQEQGFLLGYS